MLQIEPLADALGFLVRSRSLRLLADRSRAYRPGRLRTYRWRGIDVAYRPGTSDVHLIDRILLGDDSGSEYAIPPELGRDAGAVRVALDIGANIGVASLHLARAFPSARVFAFEPVAENFELLQRNTRAVSRITAVEAALGADEGDRALYASDVASNLGGFSLYQTGSDLHSFRSVHVRNSQRAMDRLGIVGAEVIKIDTEGSEWEILTSLCSGFLASTRLIFGELHGERDDDLLGFLSELFDVETSTQVGGRRSNFRALRRPSPSP